MLFTDIFTDKFDSKFDTLQIDICDNTSFVLLTIINNKEKLSKPVYVNNSYIMSTTYSPGSTNSCRLDKLLTKLLDRSIESIEVGFILQHNEQYKINKFLNYTTYIVPLKETNDNIQV